jgi:hypothetical protein
LTQQPVPFCAPHRDVSGRRNADASRSFAEPALGR